MIRGADHTGVMMVRLLPAFLGGCVAEGLHDLGDQRS